MRILTPLLVSPPFELAFGSVIAGFTPPQMFIRREMQNAIISRSGIQQIERNGNEYIEREAGERLKREQTEFIERI